MDIVFMPKNILIFSDGTGQIGGMKPDQQLSNIYKMYRAMRPGPDSPIKPNQQIAFYDPGLGAGETDGITFKRIRNLLEASVGTGIDDNVIDCYSAIISNYKPGDKIHLFGFSRGAYTVRSVANVMNLCGIPTKMPNGKPVPKHGHQLRKIATDAVKYVYNHGAGYPRDKYEDEREEKARRFRIKYGSEGIGLDGENQGNIQPTFIGVFDTVAALGNKFVSVSVALIATILISLFIAFLIYDYPSWLVLLTGGILGITLYWFSKVVCSQFKYFYDDENYRPNLFNPLNWLSLKKHGHFAYWSRKNYDRFLDNKVRFARHAVSIDENRESFPRVGWGHSDDMKRNAKLKPAWFKQVWFAGNHSDIGGSYLESESRLSDISLQWMVNELKEAVPSVKIRHNQLITSPDPLGLQHDEVISSKQRFKIWTWKTKHRDATWADVHPSVMKRFKAPAVPQLNEIQPYRPNALKNHKKFTDMY